MEKSKIIAVAFCLIIIILTILRFFIDGTTAAGGIVRSMWILSGASATIVGLISLINAKKAK